MPPTKPPAAGKSSFDLIDAAGLLAELRLAPGSTFLDLGCGEGRYTFPVAEVIGPDGLIYAVDLWEEGIAAIGQRAAAEGRRNLKALLADVGQIPLETASVDTCLMATVLHDLVEARTAAGALTETARVLKPGGRLAIVEFDKVAGPPGPPVQIRLAPAEVAQLVRPYGFKETGQARVGPYNYLQIFVKAPEA
jgi:ubiquinone/menaquinone biosynthesis C-methylase UbiE